MGKYEDQVKKWALEYYKDRIDDLDFDAVDRVTLETTTIYGGYCETCAYEEQGYLVAFFDADGNKLTEIESPEYAFDNILKQIIEA